MVSAVVSPQYFYFWFADQKEELKISVLVCFFAVIITVRVAVSRVEMICSVLVHIHAPQQNCKPCGGCLEEFCKSPALGRVLNILNICSSRIHFCGMFGLRLT